LWGPHQKVVEKIVLDVLWSRQWFGEVVLVSASAIAFKQGFSYSRNDRLQKEGV
jgi:hypothetical protein